MSDAASVKVIKEFSYRQSTKLFSNRYHFKDGYPNTDSKWENLFDAVVAAEKAIYGDVVHIKEAVGYAPDSDIPIHSAAYNTAGTLTLPDHAQYAPGDCVALARLQTDARSTKNHPIYCFSYYHSVMADYVSDDEQDLVVTAQRTAIGDYLDAWVAGFSDGTDTYVRCSPRGANIISTLVEQYITHRDFPR